MNISDLTLEEREIHINMTADDHTTWIVYTDDPYWITRLDRISTCVREEEGGGRHYVLDKAQVSLRKKMKLTDARRKELSESLSRRRKQSRAFNSNPKQGTL